jgi:hypothetical protein
VSLSDICLHPYYSAKPEALVDGKLKEYGLGSYCPTDRFVSGDLRFDGENYSCSRGHFGIDINVPAAVQDFAEDTSGKPAPFRALRSPFDAKVVGAVSSGKFDSLNLSLESVRPVQLIDGSFATVRVTYIHLGIAKYRRRSGDETRAKNNGGWHGLPHDAPIQYSLVRKAKGHPSFFAYYWPYQLTRMIDAQPPNNGLMTDRLEHWLTLKDLPAPFVVANKPSITGDLFLATSNGVDRSIHITESDFVSDALVVAGDYAFGRVVFGIAAPEYVAFELFLRGLLPASTSLYDTVDWFDGRNTFSAVNIWEGQLLPQGHPCGFAGNTGNVSSSWSGATAGRHLHLKVEIKQPDGSFRTVHPNNLKWRV